MFFADTGTAVMWLARHIKGGKNRRLFGSFSWASTANAAPNAFGAQLAYPGRQTIAICGDRGFTMLGMGDLLTQVERKTPVIHILLNNESLDFVSIEQQEAGFIPYGVAWQPFSPRDIVVRSGYGRYANRLSFYGGGTNLGFLPPFQFSKLPIGAANSQSDLQQPFPTLPPASTFPNFLGTMLPGPPYTGDRTPLLAGFMDANFKEATTQHYDLEIQAQYKSYLFSLAYAGATSISFRSSPGCKAKRSTSFPTR